MGQVSQKILSPLVILGMDRHYGCQGDYLVVNLSPLLDLRYFQKLWSFLSLRAFWT